MWSSSLQPAGRSAVHPASPAWDASANAASVASSTPAGFGLCSDTIQACAREIDQAPHLLGTTKDGALQLLSTLARLGYVEVTESPQGRKEMGAVQWAMERTLRGTEVIMTPDLPTPFRTYGQADVDPAQAARAGALIHRFQREDPLYLIFCHDSPAAEEANPVYAREVLKPAQKKHLPLYQIRLSGTKSHFPYDLSGAFILSPKGPEPAIFAVRAAQVDKMRMGAPLSLWWAQARSAAGPAASGAQSASAVPSAIGRSMPSPADVIRPHLSGPFASFLQDWSSYLEDKTQQPLTQLIGRDAAMLLRR